MNGSVRRRGDSWYFMFDAGEDPATGKRRRRSKSGFETRRAATEAMREAMRAAELGVTAPGDVPTVAALVDEWLAGRRPSLKLATWDSYRDVLEGHVVSRLGALRSDKLTAKHVADLRDELLVNGGRDRRGPGLSERTVRYTLAVLSQLLGDAVKRGILTRNVAEHVDKPRVPKKEMDWWTVDEARRFLNHTAEDRLSALWTLALTSGMRRGELLGLHWSDIDFDAGRLAVRRALVATGYQVRYSEPKTTASKRVVSIDPGTVAALKEHRRHQLEERMALGVGYLDEDVVFATISGEVLHPDYVSKRFNRLVKQAGVRRIRFHDTRHTAATLMLEQGVPLKIVTERLGHSSTAITSNLYQHASESMQEDAAAKLGAALLKGRSDQ